MPVWVAKTSELIGSSPESYEDATRQVLARARRTLRGLKSVTVREKRMRIVDGRPEEYRVRLLLDFDVAPAHREMHD